MINTIASNIINELLEVNKEFFSRDEIISFIKNLTHRGEIRLDIESNGVKISPEKYHVEIDGVNYQLVKKEFELLYYLMSNKNKIMRRHEIIRDVWGTEVIVLDRTIDVHILRIRHKLNLKCIHTNKGLGYMWVEK